MGDLGWDNAFYLKSLSNNKAPLMRGFIIKKFKTQKSPAFAGLSLYIFYSILSK
jgi:hypothetical protein